MKIVQLAWATAIGLCGSLGVGATPSAGPLLQSAQLRVRVDPAFPRALEYTWTATGARLSGAATDPGTLAVDGTNYTPRVAFHPAADRALWTLDVPELGLSLDVAGAVKGNVLEWTIPAVRESGVFQAHTLAFPGLPLLTLRDNQRGARVATAHVTAEGRPLDEFYDVAGRATDTNAVPRTYVIVNTRELAATVVNNVLLDEARLKVQTVNADGVTETRVTNGTWTWRGPDGATVETPFARVVITADRNGDGQVDWQDGALAYREQARPPIGGDAVKNAVMNQIAMNFASQAQHPFLRVLDDIKLVYLYTDGLGQDVQFKGYQTEGHDSSHPDYGGPVNPRAGGRDEFNFVLRRMKDFNARGGVHINATEYYPEARGYALDLVNTNKPGWAWLDQSYYADQTFDITSGRLNRRLDELRALLPDLAWVYLDVYFGKDWVAWKFARKMEQLGLPFQTEFCYILERETFWIHRANEYANLGLDSRIARFIWNDQRDAWIMDPLLRGAQNLGFLGWHEERNLPEAIRCVFVENLPTKYLQHFRLQKWTDEEARFTGDVTATYRDGIARIARGGRLIAEARIEGPKKSRMGTDNAVFVPWPPESQSRIYHYVDQGGTRDWDLPGAWADAPVVRLYELTDQGRVFRGTVPVRKGRVSVAAKGRTPYVLYREEPSAPREIVWGEGQFLRDPGFYDTTLAAWSVRAAGRDTGHIRAIHDIMGQRHLAIGGNGGAMGEVSQPVTGLKPGAWYSASVWLEIRGQRAATVGVRPWDGFAAARHTLDRDGWQMLSCSSEETQSEKASAALAIDGQPDTFWHTQYNGEPKPYPHELVVDLGAPRTLTGFTYLPRKGRGNGTIADYTFQISENGQTWTDVATGTFDTFDAEGLAAVEWAEPVTARFVKLIARREQSDQVFASVAELGLLTPPPPKRGGFQEAAVTVRKTDVRNYQDNGDKYMTFFQRARVVFQAPADGAPVEFFLRGEAGEADAVARFDDARLVEIPKPNLHGHDFFEDFENVDQYWGPFVYGFKGNTRVHLSEANPPYTRDVVDGKYSLKSAEETAALLYRTTPALLPLKPNTRYRLSFDYLADHARQHSVVVCTTDGGDDAQVLLQPLPGEGPDKQAFSAEFTTGAFDDYWIGVVKNDGGKGLLVIDNVAVDDLP